MRPLTLPLAGPVQPAVGPVTEVSEMMSGRAVAGGPVRSHHPRGRALRSIR
jgi:hypothetical protein